MIDTTPTPPGEDSHAMRWLRTNQRTIHAEAAIALELRPEADQRLRAVLDRIIGLSSVLSDNPMPFNSPQQQITAFWKHVDVPANPERLKGLDAPHWLCDWAVEPDGRIKHQWAGKHTNPARTAWDLTRGTPLGTRRLYRQCDQTACVNPEHHNTRRVDPFTPEVREAMAQWPDEHICTRCGAHKTPSGGCSNCRSEQRRKRKLHIRDYGTPPPPPPFVPAAPTPTNGHLRLLPPLEELRTEADEVAPVTGEQRSSIEELLDELFS